MEDLDKFLEWIEGKEEDELLVAWLQMISLFDEREDPPIAKPH